MKQKSNTIMLTDLSTPKKIIFTTQMSLATCNLWGVMLSRSLFQFTSLQKYS